MRVTTPLLACVLLAGACSPLAPEAPDSGSPPEVPDAGSEPVRCTAGEACSVIPGEDGLCGGTCIAQVDGPRCAGRVVAGVCATQPEASNEGPGAVGDLTLVVASMPERAAPGDVVRIEFRLKNTRTGPMTRKVEVSPGPAYELVSTTPETGGAFTVPANGSITIVAEVRALRPTVFVPGEWIALWVSVADEVRGLPLPIGFGSFGDVACGDSTFPATWCDDEATCRDTRHFYFSARCCEGVFYPGATCCSTADCSEGACIDGRCIGRAPALSFATTMLNTPQRVLLVLSDVDVPAGAGPCTDLAPQMADDLHLGEVEAWFGEVLRNRAGRAPTPFVWTIFGGLTAQDVAGDGPYYSGAFSRGAEALLKERGCLDSYDDFDKVIVASPQLQPTPGVLAEAFAPGRIASLVWTMPLLFAHELSHTFGATDLYLDSAGVLQHRLDLMGDNLGGFGTPRDGVMWGEVGLGDLDRNGAIDLAEFATEPDLLDFRDFSARLTGKGTLEVTADLGAREGGTLRRVNLNQVTVELPDDGARQDLAGSPIAAFPPEQIDVERIRAAGSVKVRVTTEYRYTAADLTRRRLPLDVTQTLQLSP